jgi:tellurite resistance protein TerC
MTFAWIGLIAFVIAAIAYDLRSGHRAAPPVKEALFYSILWTALGVAFAIVVLLVEDGQSAGEYLAGFLIEKSLSLDNLFVFAVLFTFFAVPDTERQRILVLGIVGAIVLRTIFIFGGVALLETFHWLTYALGALLVYTAYKIARHGDEEVNPDDTKMMKLLRRALPLTKEYEGGKLFKHIDGKRFGTPLLAALVMIAMFDVMFAIDSIPAIFAITTDTYIVFAANAFSLLGMVALYFLLDNLLARFRYLNYGLAVILAYVGVKLLLVDVWHPHILVSLAVVVVSLTVAALLSARVERREAAQRAASADGDPRDREGGRFGSDDPEARVGQEEGAPLAGDRRGDVEVR